MIRSLHRWPGLVAAVLLIVLSLSGAALSVLPATDALTSAGNGTGLSVAELADRVQAANPAVEQLRRSPNGTFTTYWFEGMDARAAVINPMTGAAVGPADRSPLTGWLTELHRSLFLGDGGRLATVTGAAAMLALAISGVVLVTRRTGGLGRFFASLKGPLSGRIHTEIARVAVIGFALSSLTALWMTAATFELVPSGEAMPAFPAEVSGETGFSPAAMDLLMVTPAEQLRELTFPRLGDSFDVYTLQTDAGTGYVDQGTGALLAWASLDGWAGRTRSFTCSTPGRVRRSSASCSA